MGIYKDYLEKLHKEKGDKFFEEQRPFDKGKLSEKENSDFIQKFKKKYQDLAASFEKYSYNKIKFPISEKKAAELHSIFCQIGQEVEADLKQFIETDAVKAGLEKRNMNKEVYIQETVTSFLFAMCHFIDGYEEIKLKNDDKSKGKKDFYRTYTMYYQPQHSSNMLKLYYNYFGPEGRGDGSSNTKLVSLVLGDKKVSEFTSHHVAVSSSTSANSIIPSGYGRLLSPVNSGQLRGSLFAPGENINADEMLENLTSVEYEAEYEISKKDRVKKSNKHGQILSQINPSKTRGSLFASEETNGNGTKEGKEEKKDEKKASKSGLGC